MNHEHDNHKKVIVCPTKTCEDITVSVPVEVKAHAAIGDIVLKCKGTRINGHYEPKNISKFEIVQEISAQIPIDFVTEVNVNDEHVVFDVHDCK